MIGFKRDPAVAGAKSEATGQDIANWLDFILVAGGMFDLVLSSQAMGGGHALTVPSRERRKDCKETSRKLIIHRVHTELPTVAYEPQVAAGVN